MRLEGSTFSISLTRSLEEVMRFSIKALLRLYQGSMKISLKAL